MSTIATQQKPKFIIVYGAPRTGTSLLMDILVASQYNPGRCFRPPENIRRGRWEHPVFGQDPLVWEEARVWGQIEEEGINCCKVVGYPEWIEFLARRFDVRIIAPNRGAANASLSAADMLVHVPSDWKAVALQKRLLVRRNAFLRQRPELPVLYVSFEKLIEEDEETFSRLSSFVGYEGAVENLMAPVDKSRVKFNGSP